MYVVGTQEALGGIVKSMFKSSKAPMNNMISQTLGPNYVMLSSVSLTATHLVIFVSKRLSPLISNVHVDTLATGFKNKLGNKGAVKISFKLVDKEFMFINCHLHSGLDGVAKRNHDIAMLMSKFVYKQDRLSPVIPDVELPDLLMLLGDMNYRINGFKKSVAQAIQ